MEISEVREAHWRETLEKAAELATVDLDDLPTTKTAREKGLLAAIMEHTTSASNAWIAKIWKSASPLQQFSARWWMVNDEQRCIAEELIQQVRENI